MVELYVNKNVVFLSKGQYGLKYFVENFLVKYENQTVLDFRATKMTGKRTFKFTKERRELYVEDQYFIIFSRGLLSIIPPSEYRITSCIPDSLNVPQLSPEEIKKTLKVFDLRDDQVIAVNKCLKIKRGVIQLPTATGKSAIIASTIKRLHQFNPKMHTLVLAPTLSTVENINETFKENRIASEVFGKPNKEIVSPVTTSLVQTLMTKAEEDPHFLNSIDAVFYDECLPPSSKILVSIEGNLCYRTIKEIYEDEKISEVLSYNTETNSFEVKKILRKFKTPFNQRYCKIYYSLNGKEKGLTCTDNHKIWTKRGYVQAQDLTENDFLFVYDDRLVGTFLANYNYHKVEAFRRNVGKVSEFKYNIEVEDNHNYFADDILVSNCHHLKCETWNKLNTLLPNVEYSLGFSALSIDKKDIFKSDIRDIPYDSALIIGSSGRVLMHMDPSYYIENHIIALPVVFRVNNYISLPADFDETNWANLAKVGLMSTARTDKISTIASMFSRNNRKTLILISEKDYAFVLGRFLYNKGCRKFGISFGAGKGYICDDDRDYESNEIHYRKEESLEVLNKLGTGEIDVLIGTSHIDEGVDVKNLDVCILASGGKRDRRIIQRLGRVLRKSKTGKYAYIVDFTDNGSRVLSRQSRARLKMYTENIKVPKENLFDEILTENIESVFKKLEDIDVTSNF